MKKKYENPMVIIEQFLLNENIAACETEVLFGPKGENENCGDYGFGDVEPFNLEKSAVPFYDTTNCQCYYTAPKTAGYFGNS